MADLAQGLTLRVGVWERDLDQGLRTRSSHFLQEMFLASPGALFPYLQEAGSCRYQKMMLGK